MMNSHTPGPWVATLPNELSYPNAVRTLITAGGRMIATVFRARGVTDFGFTHGSIGELSPAETEANAQLIAKAPDMLALLTQIASTSGSLTVDNGVVTFPDGRSVDVAALIA